MATYRYWRLYITAGNATFPLIGSMELRESEGGENLAISGNGTPTASSASGSGVWGAFDGNQTTIWIAASPDSGSGPWWITWDFGAGQSHDISFLTIRNPGNYDASKAVKTAVLQGSNDDTTWSPVIYVIGHPSSAGTSVTYTLPATATFDLHAPMPALSARSGGTAALTPASPVVSAYTGAFARVAPPSPVVSAACGASAYLTAPKPSLSALGHDSTGEQAAYLTAPSPTLAVATGANAKSIRPRAPQLSTTGTVTTLAAASLVAPSAVLTSGGTVAAMAVAALSPPSPNLIGYGGAVVSVALAGGPTLQVTGTTGGVAGVTVAAPLFQLSSSAAQQNHGSVDILAPSPRMGATAQAWLVAPMGKLTAIGSAVITATYEAYAINLLQPLDSNPSNNYEAKVPAVTRYTNFPFTHVVRYQNSYYGANSTGLYLLEGTTDDGAPIPFAIKTCETDFGAPEHKTVESVYFAGRLGNTATVTLFAREETTHVQTFTTPRNTKPQSHRQKFARGLKARYFALGLSGTKEFELDTVDLSVGTTKRRI